MITAVIQQGRRAMKQEDIVLRKVYQTNMAMKRKKREIEAEMSVFFSCCIDRK